MPFRISGFAPARPRDRRNRGLAALRTPVLNRAALVAALLAVVAAAPPDAGALTREEAVARALAASPAVVARALGVEAGAARVTQAGRRPNPEFDIDIENVSGSLPGLRESETTFLLRQAVATGGRRSARQAEAREALARAASDASAVRIDLAREVSLVFVEGLAAEERLALLDESLAVADTLVVTVEQKVRLGATLVSETARSRAARSLVAIERDAAARELARLRGELAGFWNGTAADVVDFEGTLDGSPPAATPDSLLARHPLVARWRIEERLRAAGARVSRAEGGWMPSVAAGYRLLDGTDGGTFVVGVSTTLPLFDRNRDAARAAELSAREAGQDAESMLRLLDRQAASLRARMTSGRQALDALRTTLLPATAEAYAGVDSAYRLGRLTYLDLLDARRSVVDARLLELDARADLRRLEVELDWILGDAGAAIGEVR